MHNGLTLITFSAANKENRSSIVTHKRTIAFNRAVSLKQAQSNGYDSDFAFCARASLCLGSKQSLAGTLSHTHAAFFSNSHSIPALTVPSRDYQVPHCKRSFLVFSAANTHKKDHAEEGAADEEETQEIIEDEGTNMVSARPRRMSEVKEEAQPILPIPEGSSFFIMSQTNRCARPHVESSGCCISLVRIVP